MDLIRGESLARRLQSGPMGLTQVSAIGRQILEGVSAIHSAGVIHRDIKSHNIMVGEANGSVTIIDFGLAVDVAARSRVAASHGRRGSRLAEGSRAYMAPEQFSRNAPAPALDVFAVGVVLFQALTGTLPFATYRSPPEAGARRDPLEPTLRVRSVAPDVPASVDDFLARCLCLEPDQRYQSAGSALAALERALG